MPNVYPAPFPRFAAPRITPAPESVVSWPSTARLLHARGAKGAGQWLKTLWRQAWHQPFRHELLRTLERHPDWARRFNQLPGYFHCAISHFIDRRHDAAARVQAMATDLRLAAEAFGPELTSRVARGEWVRLWSLGDQVHLCLGANDVSYHEGLWSLALRDNEGRRLYYLSFSFLAGDQLLVPTVQGPTGLDTESKELIRQLTKQAEGLRPQALLMAALREMAATWGIQRLAGLDPAHHIKGRWNLRKRRLRFDYTGFWQEHGGAMAADGHWTLPLQAVQRPLADVPSQKRAMYRRRYALLQGMAQSIVLALMPPHWAAWVEAA